MSCVLSVRLQVVASDGSSTSQLVSSCICICLGVVLHAKMREALTSWHVPGLLKPSTALTGLDNVRNMTGSPIAGIDPHELLDVRPLNYGMFLWT